MPFIDIRITVTLTDEQKDMLKAEFAKAVTTFGKGESFLMVGIIDDYDLWMGGRKLDRGAYISFSMIGDTHDEACAAFSRKVCDFLEQIADIAPNNVYLTFHPLAPSRWGWNGATF